MAAEELIGDIVKDLIRQNNIYEADRLAGEIIGVDPNYPWEEDVRFYRETYKGAPQQQEATPKEQKLLDSEEQRVREEIMQQRIKKTTELISMGKLNEADRELNMIIRLVGETSSVSALEQKLAEAKKRTQSLTRPVTTIQEAGKILGTTNIENIGRLEENIFVPKNSNLHFLAAKILGQNIKFERRENDILSTGTITKDENFKNKLIELSREADTNKNGVVEVIEILEYLRKNEDKLGLQQ